MSLTALISATESLKKREGILLPTLKTIFFEELKERYNKKTIAEVLTGNKGGSWGHDFFECGIKAKVLRSPDIRFGFIDFKNAEERYFTKKEIETFALKDNDILVIKSNGSLDLVGKSQIYKENEQFENVIASNFLLVLSPNVKIIFPEFLDLFLKSPESLVWKYDTQKTTTGLRNLNTKGFLNIEIPVPNTIEEQKILFNNFKGYLNGEINENDGNIKMFYNLSIKEELKFAQQKLQLDLLSKLRKQILQDAVQGKLVPHDRNEESATILLKRIKAEKEQLIREKKIRKEESLPAIKPEEIPYQIPENWAWWRLGDVCTKIGSGSTPRGSNYSIHGIPFFRSQNIHDGGLVYDDIKFIDNQVQKQMAGTKVERLDLLLNITGGSLGRCAIVPKDFTEGNVSQHVCIIRPLSLNNDFFHSIVLSPYFQKLIFESTTGAGREGLPKYNLEKFIVPIPPIAEQCRIQNKIEQLMRLCDELEFGIQQNQKYTQELLQVALKEALEPLSK